MVLGLLASAVTPLAAYAFPTFASYKAIKANDPSQMIPWLMFWSVQACLLFVEHWAYVFLQWVPLYKEAKMILTLWMMMPQTQGATYLYLHYIHPNIARHEHDLDNLLIGLHEQIRSRGGQYVELLFVKISEILFGPSSPMSMPSTPSRNQVESQASDGGYIASLFSRFRTVPVGAYPETLPSSLLGFLSQSSARGGDIIPANLSAEERTKYVQQQKARLQEWLHMLEAAEQSYPSVNVTPTRSLPPDVVRRNNARSASGMAASRSVSGQRTPVNMDSDYEDLGSDEHWKKSSNVTTPETSSGGWFWKSRSD